MGGSAKYCQLAVGLAYGEDAQVLKDKRVASVQALSGTGAVRLFADFIKRFRPETEAYLPVPTWSKYGHNSIVCFFFFEMPLDGIVLMVSFCFQCDVYSHHNIFRDANVNQHTYRYYLASTRGLDLEGLKEDLKVRDAKSRRD